MEATTLGTFTPGDYPDDIGILFAPEMRWEAFAERLARAGHDPLDIIEAEERYYAALATLHGRAA